MKFNGGIYDAHVHTHGGCGLDLYLRKGLDHLSAAGIDGENLLCVKLNRAICTADAGALLLKAQHPDKFSVYLHPAIEFEGFGHTPEGIRKQVEGFIEAGADGLKLADGNAGETPLDAPLFAPLFDLLEQTGFPVLYHVGATTEYPPRRVLAKNRHVQCPPFLVYRPGADDDAGSRPGIPAEVMEAKYAQIERALNRHPGLRITFPHMFYRSNDLDRLAGFLDRHPTVSVDLTPVYEIYYHFAQNVRRTRDFLIAYQDRVFLGTDNDTESDPFHNILLFRRFFETDETFFVPKYGFDMKGVGPFPEEALRKIYRQGFLRMCDPKPLNPKKAAAYCEQLYETVRCFEELPEPNKQEVLEAAKRLDAMGSL